MQEGGGGLYAVAQGVLIRGMRYFRSQLRPPSIEKCSEVLLASSGRAGYQAKVLWMLASFLRCHSTRETLNLTVLEFRRGGLYLRGIKIPPQDFALIQMPLIILTLWLA